MKRRAFIAGLLIAPFAVVTAKAVHGEVVSEDYVGLGGLLPHQKQALYGLYYGMGWKKISEAYNISLEDSKWYLGYCKYGEKNWAYHK